MPNEGLIKIKSGFHDHDVEAGKTVRQYREEYGPMFRIPADAKGYSGNQMLADDHVCQAGMTLEFVKKSGEKG